jgi:serine/threonine protein kinase/ankyrin repeat protein
MTSSGEVVDLAAANDVLHQRVNAAHTSRDYESLKKFLTNRRVVKPMFAQLDASGCTPLQVAVALGDIVLVEALLSAMDASDVNSIDRYGNTALHEACKASATKNDRVLEALLAVPGLDVCVTNADQNTALHYFCQKYSTVNCAQLGARLLELGGMPLVLKQNKNGETALHYAMFNPQFRLPMARFLIRATTGERVGKPSKKGGEPEASTESSADNRNVADDAGMRFLNAQNNKGETALHYAVHMLRPDVVQLLLGAGADHRIQNKAHDSPRSLADALMKKGADATHGAAAATAVTSGDPLPLIITALDNSAFLREWLDQLALGSLVGNFVRGNVTRNELAELTEQHLTDLGIRSAGDRIRLTKAIKELRKGKGGDKKSSKKSKKRGSAGGGGGTGDGAAAAAAAGAAAGASASASAGSATTDPADAAPAQPDFGSERMQRVQQQLEKLQYIKVDSGDWIDAKSLEFLEELGSGACGVVMRGVYRHPKDGSVHQVAIKVLKEAETEKETDEFKKEFQILSAVKSPYMVHFFGACLHPQMAMVMELCTKGSVWKVLQTDSGIKVGWPQVLEWGVQLCSGVAALHANNPQIVHRDLKTLNLLLADNWIIKVCDFGLSRFSTSSNVETLAKLRGTMAYSPPEAYFGEHFNDRSDIYSVAVILWEMANRCIKGEYNRPFYEFPNMTLDFQIIIQVARKGKRPTLPPTTPPVLSQLIERCWTKERDTRPDAATVRDELKAMQASFASDPAPWQASLIGRAAEEAVAAAAASAAAAAAAVPLTKLPDGDEKTTTLASTFDPDDSSSSDESSSSSSSSSASNSASSADDTTTGTTTSESVDGLKKTTSRRKTSRRVERRASKNSSSAAPAVEPSEESDSESGGKKVEPGSAAKPTLTKRRIRKERRESHK